MAEDPVALKRGLFGFSRRSVMDVLVQRDGMLGRTQQRLTMTEAELTRARAIIDALRGELGDRTRRATEEIARLEKEVAEARSDAEARTAEARAAGNRIAELELEVEELRRQLQKLEEERTADEGGAFAGDALGKVLQTAEQALAGLFQRARRGNQRELEEIERAREELRAEREQLDRRREEIGAVMRSIRDSATGAMTSVKESLGELVAVVEGLDGEAEAAVTSIPEVGEADAGGNGAVWIPDEEPYDELPADYRSH
jgi:DNA repair exonuclease SbcCD ATPase subunit